MSSTGYKNIYKNPRDNGKPYYVAKRIYNKNKTFKYFATLEDALSYVAMLPPRKYVPRISDDVVEGWIEQRRNGKRWIDISRNYGHAYNNRNAVPISLYAYLRRKGRLNEAESIWNGRSTTWLDRILSKRRSVLRDSETGKFVKKPQSR